MRNEVIASALGTAVSATGTALQPNDVLQTISLVVTIIGGIITAGSMLYMWWKKAKEDGKITKDEIAEGVEIVKKTTEDITEAVKKGKDNGKVH